MADLSLKLLGTPEAGLDGRILRFRTRKTLGLLAYLSAEGGMHGREALTRLLWPRSANGRGRVALRSALAGLRGALDEARGTVRPEDRHLVVERDSLGVRRGSLAEFDLGDLRVAYDLARTPARVDDEGFDGSVALLEKAVDAYRGEFLEGFHLADAPEFEHWASLERESWRARLGVVLDRLSRVRSERGELPAAIEAATAWVRHDPLAEAAHLRLMETLYAAGDRSGALAAYEDYRSATKELGGPEPGPLAQALAGRIRAEYSPAPRPIRRASGATRSTLDLPLVGRAEEFGSLVGEYHKARSGETRAVFVLGETGIGKTRLVGDFLEWARAEGADVLDGRALETSSTLPYGPVVDALRGRVDLERAPDDLLPDVWLSELSRLLPELRERYPDLPAPASDESVARARLFETVARLGEALARRAPVVLFLDDLHWADAATLDVVRYAARRWAEDGVPLLLVMSLRTEALSTSPRLPGWLSALGRDLPSRHLTLGPLAGTDTERVLRSSIGTDPGARGEPPAGETGWLGRWLHAETGGQPFFLVQTLKTLLDEGILVARTGADGGRILEVSAGARDEDALRGLVPPGVRDVIRARLARLSPVASEVAAAGAVLGHGFGFDELFGVAGVGEGEGLSALDELVRARLVREVATDRGGAQGRYAFAHDKIREVIYTEAGDARRRVFHRRALGVLASSGEPPAQLARHAFAAGMPGPAIRHSLKAGEAALGVFATRDAIDHFERARGLLEEKGTGGLLARTDLPVADLKRLYVGLGGAREVVGEREEARAVYEEMRLYAGGTGELEWTALNRLAILTAQGSFDVRSALVMLRRALEVAEESGEKVGVAETEWNLAQMSVYARNLEDALRHGERALALARELDLKDVAARSLNIIANTEVSLGRWEEAEAPAEEARALFAAMGNGSAEEAEVPSSPVITIGAPPSRAMGYRAMEADSLALLAYAKTHTGRPREALSDARAALTIDQEIGNVWGQVSSAVPLARALLEVGEYEEALGLARQAVAAARDLGHPLMLFLGLTVFGSACDALFKLEDARSAHLETLEVVEPFAPHPYRVIVNGKLCANRALAGDWEGAHAYALEALAARPGESELQFTDLTRWYETEALVRGGDVERAREDVRRYGERVRGNRRYRIPYLRAIAVLCRHDGELGREIEHLLEARDTAREMGLPGELWQAEAALGRSYGDAGRPTEEEEAFGRAADVLRALGEAIQEESLRTCFTQAPPVREILGRS